MPKTISLGTRTLIDIRLRKITIDFTDLTAGDDPHVMISYEVLAEGGVVHEVRHVGAQRLPPGISRVLLRAWWDDIRADLLVDEGL